jgi:hypothetical protein
MRAFLLTLLSMFVPVASFAGGAIARVQHILVTDGGMLVYVYPAGGVTSPPACHGSNGDYFSFSMTRPMAKEYLALLVAAQMSGAMVSFWGKGVCQDQSVSETLDYFRVET